MQTAARVLKPGGLFLLHTISTRRSQPNLKDNEISWIDRHIFPGLCIPSLAQVGKAADGIFTIEDLHNFGVDYEKTLLAWFANFDRNWPGLRERYGERANRFYRTWKYYLQTCAGAFRSRKYGVWQMVLSPRGVAGGYRRPG
jgi:cyclopropane-fatty-acyl-phospholipid synthase